MSASTVKVFLCGDVMTGRGIDQVLPFSCDPCLFEPYVRDARQYVQLAEAANGPIPQAVGFDYVWGHSLEKMRRWEPDVRIINLETSITTSDDAWPGKRINYRMHPGNVACLTVAGIDCCVLANNHVLDWGKRGLLETLHALHSAGIHTAGAGSDDREAGSPAILECGKHTRVRIYAWGSTSSGVPSSWAANPMQAGVNWLLDLTKETARSIGGHIAAGGENDDLVIASLHWGGNWGYEIPFTQIEFAHALIDEAGVHVVYGHSSHHPKAIEVYKGQPVLYGCGDFLNDYEGISGHEAYRADLAFMYFLEMHAVTKKLDRLVLVPVRIRRFQIQATSAEETEWLIRMLNREGAKTGTTVRVTSDGDIEVSWGFGNSKAVHVTS